MSTLVGHFVSSPREREKRDRRDCRGDESEGQGRKRNRNESEETEEMETFPLSLTCYKDSRPCPTVSQFQLDAPVTETHDTFATPDHPKSWVFDRNNFSYFLSTSCPDNSYHVSSQLAFWFRRQGQNKFFKRAAIAVILDLDQKDFNYF